MERECFPPQIVRYVVYTLYTGQSALAIALFPKCQYLETCRRDNNKEIENNIILMTDRCSLLM
jgi:hypothetical protein